MKKQRIRLIVQEADDGPDLEKELRDAMWAGDVDKLHEIARCICCCSEHTFEGCPARAWYGCRGGDSSPQAERIAWQAHYEKYHGMSFDQFYGYD